MISLERREVRRREVNTEKGTGCPVEEERQSLSPRHSEVLEVLASPQRQEG